MDLIELEDLAPFADIDEDKALAMIDDATAIAKMVAPCLATEVLSDQQLAAAKALLRSAILRWNDSGNGAVSSQTMGPFGVTTDTRQARRSMFWPSEITDLQKICQGSSDGTAFSVDTAAVPMTVQPTFGGWGQGWAFNDNGTFIPNNNF